MNIATITIENTGLNGLEVYQSDDFKINDRLQRYWNSPMFKSFEEFRETKKMSDYNALIELVSDKEHLQGLEIDTRTFKGKSDPSKDFEKITLKFDNELEAKAMYEKMKNFRGSSLYSKIEQNGNELSYIYTRLFINEEHGKLQRSKKESISCQANYAEITNINKNCLEFVQQVHNFDNNLLVTINFGDGNIRYFSANESLNLEDNTIATLKEKMEGITNEVNKKTKKESLEQRGSNPVGTNMKTLKEIEIEEQPKKSPKPKKEEIEEQPKAQEQKEEIKEVSQEATQEPKQEEKKEVKPELSNFYHTSKMAFERDLMLLENNKETIMSSFYSFMKEEANVNNVLERMAKSNKNPYLKDFILSQVGENIKENQEKMTKKEEENKGLKQENKTLNNTINTMETKFEELFVTTQKATEIAQKLDKDLTLKEQENKELKTSLNDKTKEIGEYKKYIETLEKNVAKLEKARIEEQEALNKEFNKLKAKLEKENEKRTQQLDTLRSSNNDLRTSNKEYMAEVKVIKEEAKVKDTKIENMGKRLEELENTIKTLEASIKGYEIVLKNLAPQEQKEKKKTSPRAKKATPKEEEPKDLKEELEEFRNSQKKKIH